MLLTNSEICSIQTARVRMTKRIIRVIQCDGQDGECKETEVHWGGYGCVGINGVPITRYKPAPGWTSDNYLFDFCPKCSKEVGNE